jgi:hypothetical protein
MEHPNVRHGAVEIIEEGSQIRCPPDSAFVRSRPRNIPASNDNDALWFVDLPGDGVEHRGEMVAAGGG